jgi:type IV fimbrial biogenesis protein FimT
MNYRPLKLDCGREKIYPFVCQLTPFIWTTTPPILPIIGNKIPLVCFKGFTLIELIVTLTIAGILMAIAAPSMQSFVSGSRLTTQVNDLLADINISRSEAIKRNTTAGICATASGGTSCIASTNWANGWMVYADVSGVTTPIKTHEALSGNNTLTGSTGIVTYDKSGVLTSGSGVFVFTLCDPARKKTRVVTVATTGRPTITESTCP